MNIYEKLCAVQAQLKAPKSQENKFGGYRYRSCEDVLEAVKPLLATNKLILLLGDSIETTEGRIYVRATAQLINAEKPEEKITVNAFAREEESKKGMDSSQVTGAASSYARKYALNGLFCIDDTKDSDATNTATKEPPKKQEPEAKPEPLPPLPVQKYVCAGCKKEIKPYKDANGKYVSLMAHAERSKQLYGAVLCLDCIKGGTQNA